MRGGEEGVYPLRVSPPLASSRLALFIWRVLPGFTNGLAALFIAGSLHNAPSRWVFTDVLHLPRQCVRGGVCRVCGYFTYAHPLYNEPRARKPFPVKASDTPSSGESVRARGVRCSPSFLPFLLSFLADDNERRQLAIAAILRLFLFPSSRKRP